MTPNILRVFVRQTWIKRYYITDYKGDTIKPYGNVMMSKYKFHEFAVHPFDNSNMGRKMLIATFVCEGGAQLVLGTFHLESYGQDLEQRREQLTLYNKYTEHSDKVILCGDTNFIHDDEDEPLTPRFLDVWRELYHKTDQEKEDNPGYTFDTDTNIMAKREHSPRKVRIDRCFYTPGKIEPIQMKVIGNVAYDKKRRRIYIRSFWYIYETKIKKLM